MVARALEWLVYNLKIAYWICSAVWATLHCIGDTSCQCGGCRRRSGAGGKGQQNARLNGLQNVTFYHENLKKMSQSSRGRKTASIKCCWPGASRCRRCYAANYKTGTYSIVYVSCNPATLARDSEALLKQDIPLRDWRCWICSHTRDIGIDGTFLAR